MTTVWGGKPDWMEWEEGRERVRDRASGAPDTQRTKAEEAAQGTEWEQPVK